MSGALKILSNSSLEQDLVLNLANGVDEMLQTMAHATSVFEKSFSDLNWKAPCDYSVYLDIKSPPSTGQIFFHFSYAALTGLYQGMIGDNSIPDHDQLVDVLGEISNVCYGLAKGRLNREGYALGMALPHAGKTSDMPELISERPHMVLPFKVFNETCYIQIVIL